MSDSLPSHPEQQGQFGPWPPVPRVAGPVRPRSSFPAAPPYPVRSADGDPWGYPSRAGRPAALGARFTAFALDVVFAGSPVLVLVFIGLAEAFDSDQVQQADGTYRTVGGAGPAFNNVLLIVFLVAVFAYPICFIAAQGATIGMRIVGIKIVDVATRERVGFGRVVLRQVLLGLCPILAFSALFDRGGLHRGWHDRAARDVVIHAR